MEATHFLQQSPLAFILVAVTGLSIGSFLNVCIYRLPNKSKSILSRSSCPECFQPIAWYDNIPVLSFILLKGRCRKCGANISWQYPVVEMVGALLLFAAFFKFGFNLNGLIAAVLFEILLVIAITDIQHMLILNKTVLAVGLVALAKIIFTPYPNSVDAIIGLFVGGGLLFIFDVAGRIIFKKDSMGPGDIKLAAALGLYFGGNEIGIVLIMAVILTSFTGVLGIISGYLKRSSYLPFGTFIALAVIIFSLFSADITAFFKAVYGL